MRIDGSKLLRLPGHRKKLLHEGAQASGVVTESTDVNLTYGGFSAHELVVEVHFPDGSQTELREKVNVADIGALRGQVGDVLPVRYDPDDRSAVAIDVPALRAEADEKARRLNEEAVARGRRALGGEGDSPAAAIPGAGFQAAREQLVELMNLRRAYDAGQIGRDEYERRRNELAPKGEPG